MSCPIQCKISLIWLRNSIANSVCLVSIKQWKLKLVGLWTKFCCWFIPATKDLVEMIVPHQNLNLIHQILLLIYHHYVNQGLKMIHRLQKVSVSSQELKRVTCRHLKRSAINDTQRTRIHTPSPEPQLKPSSSKDVDISPPRRQRARNDTISSEVFEQ